MALPTNSRELTAADLQAAGDRLRPCQYLIVGWHREGLSLSEIARRLNSQKAPTAHGGARWHASTINKVLAGQDPSRLASSIAAP
jgi:hypothetical protein